MPRESEKVAISAAVTAVNGEMGHHFGCCGHFVIAEGKDITVVENTARDAAEGAGVKAAQLMIEQEVGVVITGGLGPRASQVLEEAGIRSHVGISGEAGEPLRMCREGRMEKPSGASGQGRKVQGA